MSTDTPDRVDHGKLNPARRPLPGPGSRRPMPVPRDATPILATDEHALKSGKGMEQATTAGFAWTTLGRVLAQVLQFGSTIVLSRLLVPEQFGLVVIVTAFTTFALLFTDLGLGAAVIHARTVTEELLCTAFWLNALSGLALTALVATLSGPIADFFDQPDLQPLLLVASLTFVLSLSAVNLAQLERKMTFKPIVAAEVGAIVLGTATAVVAAFGGVGAMSIVLGAVVQTTSTTVFMCVAAQWLPSKFVSRAALRELWAFSSHLFGYNVVNYWSRNLDDLLLGKLSGPAVLGLYNRAYGLMMQPILQVTLAINRVLFPALARMRDDADRLRSAYLRVVRMLVAAIAPVAVAMAIESRDLLAVLYGSQWVGAATLLTLLSASIPAQVLAGTGGALFRALGLTKALFRRSLITTGATVFAIIIGLHWGVTGLATALLIKFYVLLPFAMRPGWQRIEVTSARMLRNLAPIALPIGLMIVAMLVIRFGVASSPQFTQLVVVTAGGFVAYGLGIWAFAGGIRGDVMGVVARRRGTNGPADSQPALSASRK